MSHVAHENTRLWMATPVWSPAEDSDLQPRPATARPDRMFYDTSSKTTSGERIDFLEMEIQRALSESRAAVRAGGIAA